MKNSDDSSIEKLTKFAVMFDLLGDDPHENIRIILKKTCDILDGICSFYNRIDGEHNSFEMWPNKKTEKPCLKRDTTLVSDLKNTVCEKLTIKAQGKTIALSDLRSTPFFESDTFIEKHNFKSYLGFPVSLKKKVIGSLCIYGSTQRNFTTDEISAIQILAAAISVEEEKLARKSELKNIKQIELIKTITGRAAHSLNNILSGLVSYPELMLMQLPKESPLKESISFMHEAGIKAADIVQDLLYLTRGGSNDQIILNLNNAVFEYFHTREHKRIEKDFPKVGFQVKTDSELFDINGSPTHITKILQNLIANSTELIQTNGSVLIETFNQHVPSPISGLEIIPSGDYACLKISDDGLSISQNDLKNKFEPFHASKKTAAIGSGFGLCVVNNLVKDHNGYIQIESNEDKGNIFKIYFPAIL